MRDLLKRGAAPAVGLIAVALVGTVLGYTTANTSGKAAPAPPPAEARSDFVQGQVTAISGDSVTIAVGQESRGLKLTQNAPVEALRAARLTDVRAGDWLNGGAVPHPQTNYALIGIVAISPELLAPR